MIGDGQKMPAAIYNLILILKEWAVIHKIDIATNEVIVSN
jgi:hypothetical protein